MRTQQNGYLEDRSNDFELGFRQNDFETGYRQNEFELGYPQDIPPPVSTAAKDPSKTGPIQTLSDQGD